MSPRTFAAVILGLTMGLLAACTPASEVGAPTPASGAATRSTERPASPAPAPTPVVSVPVAPATAAPVALRVAPVELVIPSLDVEMPVVPVGVKGDGGMEIPERPTIAGWYRFGRTPTDDEGATVLAAHVDDREYGVGPLARLRDTQPGSSVTVTDADGVDTRYTVTTVTYIPRAKLPVADLFTREGPRTLVVITCGGSFDERTRSYSDNVVLVARAAS
ncbi:class F sortase [Microbacterium sp. 179-B 1A2 NHS]|uniref:class F sortase n=1 Tax=Microbacterium sp. 179-B 1A2 NHS TaxID=3142383 RepID=UPI00399FE631